MRTIVLKPGHTNHNDIEGVEVVYHAPGTPYSARKKLFTVLIDCTGKWSVVCEGRVNTEK